MKVRNTTAKDVHIYDLGINIGAGQTVTVYDEDAEKSKTFVDLMDRGILVLVDHTEPTDISDGATLFAALDALEVRVAALEGRT